MSERRDTPTPHVLPGRAPQGQFEAVGERTITRLSHHHGTDENTHHHEPTHENDHEHHANHEISFDHPRRWGLVETENKRNLIEMASDEREFEYGQCEATAKSTGEQCGNPASGEHGKCRFHGGASTGAPKGNDNGVGNSGGAAPKGNGNAEKHGLHADPHKYHERRDQDEKEWILDVSAAIEDRIRERRGDVDKLDRVLARRCAIKLHIASRATEHVDKDGLMQVIEVEDNGASYEKEVPHALLTELRSYDAETFRELKKVAGFGDDSDAGGMVAIKEAWIADVE